MKIALVSPYDYPYPGGVTEHVQHLDAQFRARGHTVRIIAPSSAPDRADDNVYQVGGVIHFPGSGSVVRITLSPRSDPRVKRILDRERFDIIHLHEPLMPMLNLAVLRHSASVNIGTFHAYREKHPAYDYGKAVLKRFWKRLHGRICVSEAAYELVYKYFPGEYRIIPNGIDLSEFGGPDVQPIPEYCDGKFNILFLGRMEERKGFRYLFHAFPAVKELFPQTRLIVAGSYQESEIEPYRQEARERGLEDIAFVGRVSDADKPRYYRTCHVFCAPSTGFESQGIVLLEAMAAGKPVVATDIPGYRGVITHKQEGLLVAPRSSSSLAAALVMLLACPDLREQYSAAGLRRAQRYSWDSIADEVLAYYEEVRRKVQRRDHLREVLRAR